MSESSEDQHRISRRAVLRMAAGGAVGVAAAGLGLLVWRGRDNACGYESDTISEVARIAQTSASPPTSTTTPTVSPSPTTTEIATPSSVPSPPTPLPPLISTITIAWHGDSSERKVGITIDDFDHASVVRNGLMDILSRNPDVKVTLFPIGCNIPLLSNEIPGIWRRLLDAGHEIGYHSLEHTRLAGATVGELREEILQFNTLVGEAIGTPSYRVRYARAPFGDHGDDPANFREIAEEMNIIWVLWQVIPVPALSQFSLEEPNSIQNGDIALFHDNWQEIDQLELYIQMCRERGFEMVSLSGLRLFGD